MDLLGERGSPHGGNRAGDGPGPHVWLMESTRGPGRLTAPLPKVLGLEAEPEAA